MNGVASTSMREHGLEYKLNFGVSILKIKEIATGYTPHNQLAETLWLEGTRELKILATLLYPVDEFSQDIAQRWVTQIPNQEIRELLCMNLLQKLSYGEDIAHEWATSENQDIRLTGYWLLVRCIITKEAVVVELDTLPFVWSDITSKNSTLRNAVMLLLKNVGKLSVKDANSILSKLGDFDKSDNFSEKEIFDSLSFDFNFYH